MKKLKKYIIPVIMGFIFIFSLASCGSNSFYNEWHNAGAEIEENNVFKSVTLDDVTSKINAKESFALFIGCKDDKDAVAAVSKIQYLATNVNYEGKINFLTVAKDSTDKRRKVKEVVGLDYYESSSVSVAMFDDGELVIDSINKTHFSLNDNFIVNGEMNVLALAEYAFYNYPEK